MNRLAIGAFLLFLLCFTISGITIAQTQTVVGVTQGNVFEYDMSTSFSSTSTSTPPAELVELNQTEWLRVTVTGVSGSQILTQITTHYRNGTEISSDGSSDIETGEGSGGPPFIGADLGKNDQINPSASEPWYINETVTRTYNDAPRETNHLRLEHTEESDTVGEFTQIYDYYFDKSTGVLVEYTSEFSYTGLTSITRSKLTSSNVWLVHRDGGIQQDSPTDPSTTMYVAAAAVAITILIVAAAIILKKRKKKIKSKYINYQHKRTAKKSK